MIAALAGVAVLTVAGAIAATGLPDGRARLLGLTLALTFAAFLADPFPAPVALAVRVVAALVVVFLLRATLVGGASTDSVGVTRASGAWSAVGWPSDALLATAAAVLGVALTQGLAVAGGGETTATPAGPVASTAIVGAVGFALVALGAQPALLSGGAGRITIGLLLLIQGIGLVRLAVADAPSDLEQVAFVAFLIATAAGGSTLVEAERREATALGAGRARDASTGPDPESAADHGRSAAPPRTTVPALEALGGLGSVDPAPSFRRRP